MKVHCLILLAAIALASSNDQIKIIPNRQSLFPLNFQQALKNINDKLELAKSMSTYQIDTSSFYKFWNEVKNFNPSNAPLPLPKLSSDCLAQLIPLALAFKKKEPWAISVLDAFGKPPSGILQGALFWAGDYSQCVNITEKSFNGKYCSLAQPIGPQAGLQQSFKYGICVPNFCNYDDVATLINFGIFLLPKNITQLLPVNLTFINSSFVTCSESEPLDSEATLAIGIISFLLVLVLIGTVYDLFKQYSESYQMKYIFNSTIVHTETGNPINDDEKEKIIQTYHEENESSLKKILLGFSIYTNAKKLFTVNKSDDQLQSLHAIRVLSTAWVVLGHTYVFQIGYSDDFLKVSQWIKRFSFLVVTNAFFSVDSFFLLSGLLVSYGFLKETSKKKISIRLMSRYYFHRIWRLTPTYMLVLMFSATLTKYLGAGPMYPKDGFEINKCHNSWWTNLLYVNNFFKLDTPCLGVSWYLANDMQLYFVAPLMLIPLALGKKIIGFAICTIILVGNIIITAFLVDHYPGTEQGILKGNQDFFNEIYIKPWCRIGPYVAGIILGYLILHYKKRKDFKLKFEANLLLWLLSLGLMGLMLFGIYPNVKGKPLNRNANILYQASSKTIWCIGLSYVIFACVTSHGGVINKILSWSVWVPLSRLSYCLYLFHSVVIIYFNAVQDHPIHMQDSNIIFNFVANMVFSTVGAFLVSMIFEVPFLGIEKIFIKNN